MTKILLGCIADDFTGATDLANNLVRAGMRVIQTIGVPMEPISLQADAVVVALKSRTVAPADAVAQSLQALAWLQAQGATQIYFKYCSTFDSTPKGNIGPVTDALMDALQTDFTIATPAFPDNGRTVFKGHLFVGDVLLSESGMQDHPLTPMRDANLVRVLQAQTRRKVGLIPHNVVDKGAQAIEEHIDQLRANGVAMAVVDALSNQDLMTLGKALKHMPLVTAGSGVAIGLPQNFAIHLQTSASLLPAATGSQAIVSGSCSVATQAQVAAFINQGGQALALDPLAVAADVSAQQNPATSALDWASSKLQSGPVLIYSTATPASVRAVQAQLGAAAAGTLMERTLGDITKGLVRLGVRQLIVAGGETSGACVLALGISQMQIGVQIDPGVPWCHAKSGVDGQEPVHLHLALKSGNFGSPDFFTKAFQSA